MFYQSTQSRRAQAVVAMALLFLFLGYRSWVELSYAIQGRIISATIKRSAIYDVHNRGTSHWMALEYQFTDPAGDVRLERDDVPLPENPPQNGCSVDIQYRPGVPGASRIAGHDHQLELAIFLVMIAFGLVIIGLHSAMPKPPLTGTGMFDSLT
jgi:hypothetical protein